MAEDCRIFEQLNLIKIQKYFRFDGIKPIEQRFTGFKASNSPMDILLHDAQNYFV